MQDRAEKIQYLGNSWLRSGLKSFCLLFVVVVVVFSYSWTAPLARFNRVRICNKTSREVKSLTLVL